MGEAVIALADVARAFGPVPALAGLSLTVEPGTVTALLGPNGAGKTTTVRVITGGLRIDQGDVRVFGVDPYLLGGEVRKRCGVVAAKPALYDRLSGRDNLLYAARLYGIGDDHDAIARAAERFGIAHALGQRVGTYSTGMKTRLALARAVLHDPALLLLDEPTAGLDPESARAVLTLIDDMAAAGKTVLLCTHLLAEAEGLADHVVIMEGGRALVQGPPAELAQRYWPHALVVVDAVDRETLEIARGFDGVAAYERTGIGHDGAAEIMLHDLSRVPDLIEHLTKHGARLTRVEPRVPTLEELYFRARRGALG